MFIVICTAILTDILTVESTLILTLDIHIDIDCSTDEVRSPPVRVMVRVSVG